MSCGVFTLPDTDTATDKKWVIKNFVEVFILPDTDTDTDIRFNSDIIRYKYPTSLFLVYFRRSNIFKEFVVRMSPKKNHTKYVNHYPFGVEGRTVILNTVIML